MRPLFITKFGKLKGPKLKELITKLKKNIIGGLKELLAPFKIKIKIKIIIITTTII